MTADELIGELRGDCSRTLNRLTRSERTGPTELDWVRLLVEQVLVAGLVSFVSGYASSVAVEKWKEWRARRRSGSQTAGPPAAGAPAAAQEKATEQRPVSQQEAAELTKIADEVRQEVGRLPVPVDQASVARGAEAARAEVADVLKSAAIPEDNAKFAAEEIADAIKRLGGQLEPQTGGESR